MQRAPRRHPGGWEATHHSQVFPALSQEERASALSRMSAEGVDVLVVGGGITGAGVALDAAARGYRVGLVEKDDFASGTSGRSTKLVHGGIRYLPQFDLALVREGLVERGLLLRNAPFLVRPVGFVLPLYEDAQRPLGTPIVPPFGLGMRYLLRSGLVMYDLLAGGLRFGYHRHIGRRGATSLAPGLRTLGLTDAFLYEDGQTDDTRLTVTVVRTAALWGALVANYAEAVGFEQIRGKIAAVHVRDGLRGQVISVPVGAVVNAGGVFANRVESLTGDESQVRIEPAKGVHLTVARETMGMHDYAVVLPETEDGRILFIVPWGPRLIVGTTDTPGGDVDRPVATPGDVAYLLRHVNRYTRFCLTTTDVISTWAGYRPLLTSRRADVPSARLSRTHTVVDGPGGMVTIVGGKLTTYRRMAQDAMDRVARHRGEPERHVTEHLLLEGTVGWQEATEAARTAAARYGWDDSVLRRLGSYGAKALAVLALVAEDTALAERVVVDLPYIMAEAVYACRYEMAVNLDDVLLRRLHLGIEDRVHGRHVAPAVARRIARELGWDSSEMRRQIARYDEIVARELRGGLDAR